MKQIIRNSNIKDAAAEANVSTKTVTRVIKKEGSVRYNNRERVKRAIEKLLGSEVVPFQPLMGQIIKRESTAMCLNSHK